MRGGKERGEGRRGEGRRREGRRGEVSGREGRRMYSKYQYYRNDEIGMYRVNAHKVDGREERVGWR